MAKRIKAAPEVEAEDDDVEEDAPAKKEVNVKKLKRLFAEYEAKNEALEEAKKAQADALAERSAIVVQILEANGGSKKIRYKGEELSITSRGETTFFRAQHKAAEGLTEID